MRKEGANQPFPYEFLILGGILILSLVLAWFNHFIQDDAFISFVYARNLVQGQGLTWFGVRVEGYTNFLWVLWVALGMEFGIDPVKWSYLGGMISFAAAIQGMWALGRMVFARYVPALLCILLFVTNYTAVSYATGGLETMLQTALLCQAMVRLFKIVGHTPRIQDEVLFSLFVALAVLTRMDSLLPSVVMGMIIFFDLYRKKASWTDYCAVAIPALLLIGVWLSWKMHYYGRLLPNSFYVKVNSEALFNLNGLTFIARFFHWYLLWPLGVVGTMVLFWRQEKIIGGTAPFWAVCGSWMIYILWVGGDFMEFRFFVPIMPFLCLILGYLIYRIPKPENLKISIPIHAGCLAILIGASFHHAKTFKGITSDQTLDSIKSLRTFYGVYTDLQWDRIGRLLKEELQEVDPVLAMHPVGAIPYYSGLKTVDMYGLNDLVIPISGSKAPASYLRPGHGRHATFSYLKQMKVNFILAHPTFIRPGCLNDSRLLPVFQNWVANAISFNNERIGQARLVALPLDNKRNLLMWYLTPTKAIDRFIRQKAWETSLIEVE